MSFTHKLTSRWSSGGSKIEVNKDYTATGEDNADYPVASDASDAEIAFTLTILQMVSFYMVADQDVTVKTNSSGAPAETIALKANVPFVQNADIAAYFAGATELLVTDIGSIFVTNDSNPAVATTLKIRCVYTLAL